MTKIEQKIIDTIYALEKVKNLGYNLTLVKQSGEETAEIHLSTHIVIENGTVDEYLETINKTHQHFKNLGYGDMTLNSTKNSANFWCRYILT